MPLKLIAPRKGKSPNWSIRGTYLGIYVDRSCGTDRKSLAGQRMRELQGRIERGEYPEREQPQSSGATFLSAAVAYMKAGRSPANLDRLILHFGNKPIAEIGQVEIDDAAITLLPHATPATRNRKVYTPVSAVLHHAGQKIELKRPKGAKGRVRTDFLTPDDAGLVIGAALEQDRVFGVLLLFLLYTGSRISEALALDWSQVDLEKRLAYIAMSKNDDPRTALLRKDLCAELSAIRPGDGAGPVFPIRKGGGLKDRLVRAKLAACGVLIPKRSKRASRRIPAHRLSWATFHTFCHTWATWMRRYGGADLQALVATDRWRDPRSAARYSHVHAHEEWHRVDDLPSIEIKRG